MALSQLRMHHLTTGALPPRTEEEHAFVDALEGADADAGCNSVTLPLADGSPITGPGGEFLHADASADLGGPVPSAPMIETPAPAVDASAPSELPAYTSCPPPDAPLFDPENVTPMHQGRPAPKRRR